MIWKSAILLWVAYFLVKYIVRANISREEQIKIALGGNPKWTPERVVFVIVFFAAIITSIATLVWFLFFVL